jgi:hypothetical protein
MVYPVFHVDDIPQPAEVKPEVTESSVAPVIGANANLQVADGDKTATERWHRLTQQECDVGRTAGTLWVGSCQEALQWAGQHVAYVVNAADADNQWHPWCL